MNTQNLLKILEAREARAVRQRELLAGGGTLVCFTLNIPGPVKNTELYRLAWEEGIRRLQEKLKGREYCLFREENAAGRVCFLQLAGTGRAEAEEVKKLLTGLEEEAPLGRLFDMDVLYSRTEPETGLPVPVKLSRTELGKPARRCLICGRPAFLCLRAGRHTVPEVLLKTADLLLSSPELEERIFSGAAGKPSGKTAAAALRALLYEVIITPKPGLVDTENNGAHRDMDIASFFDSALALAPYFEACVAEGERLSGGAPETVLSCLRPLGIAAEENMYRVTGGVNTHKGAVFTMGVLCAASGMLRKAEAERAGQAENLLALAGRICSVMENGTPEIRREFINGYPSLRETALPLFREYRNEACNTLGVRTLLALLSRVEDSNILRRKGRKTAVEIREKASALAAWTAEEKKLLEAAAALDCEFIRENISPGGCADLLAAAWFLRFDGWL